MKNNNVLSQASYQILNNEFGEMSSTLFKNECKNQGKPVHGRRYDDEVKKFAVTLHYHSPKAYGYCRLAFSFCFFNAHVFAIKIVLILWIGLMPWIHLCGVCFVCDF